MRRRLALLAAFVGGITLVGAAGAATPAPTTGSDGIHVAPVTRLPFPERGYVVSVPESGALDSRSVVVRENGVRATGVRVDPLARSGLRYGVVLALDASESMTGGPRPRRSTPGARSSRTGAQRRRSASSPSTARSRCSAT